MLTVLHGLCKLFFVSFFLLWICEITVVLKSSQVLLMMLHFIRARWQQLNI